MKDQLLQIGEPKGQRGDGAEEWELVLRDRWKGLGRRKGQQLPNMQSGQGAAADGCGREPSAGGAPQMPMAPSDRCCVVWTY